MPFASAAQITVTIASGASLSDAAEVGSATLVGIILPVFTSAALSFQESADGVTYYEALDAAGAAVSVAASVGSRYIPAPTTLTAPFIKVRSGLVGAPVAQGADRIIALILK